MFGSQRAFCSGVPWASSVGPTRLTPIRPTSSGARARASSSVTMKCSTAPAPRPPYSSGHATPTHRPPASFPCHSRRKATSSARSSKRGGSPLPYSQGRCSRSQARTSARSAASSSVGVRSTRNELLLPALLDGHVRALGRAHVDLARAPDLRLRVLHHLLPMGDPARKATHREEHGEHVHGE